MVGGRVLRVSKEAAEQLALEAANSGSDLIIVDALAEVDVSGVASTAGQVAANTLRCPPKRRPDEYVDHHALLPECDVMITHAGLGTVAAALSRGVRLVCVPLGRDQHLNAARVAACGTGVVADAVRDLEAVVRR